MHDFYIGVAFKTIFGSLSLNPAECQESCGIKRNQTVMTNLYHVRRRGEPLLENTDDDTRTLVYQQHLLKRFEKVSPNDSACVYNTNAKT